MGAIVTESTVLRRNCLCQAASETSPKAVDVCRLEHWKSNNESRCLIILASSSEFSRQCAPKRPMQRLYSLFFSTQKKDDFFLNTYHISPERSSLKTPVFCYDRYIYPTNMPLAYLSNLP